MEILQACGSLSPMPMLIPPMLELDAMDEVDVLMAIVMLGPEVDVPVADIVLMIRLGPLLAIRISIV